MARVSKERKAQLQAAQAKRQRDMARKEADAKETASEKRWENSRVYMRPKRAEKKLQQQLRKAQHPEEAEAEAAQRKVKETEADFLCME